MFQKEMIAHLKEKMKLVKVDTLTFRLSSERRKSTSNLSKSFSKRPVAVHKVYDCEEIRF